MPSLIQRLFVLLSLVVGLAAVPAVAQTWPSKPIRLLVGFPPGGGVDLLARLLADKLASGLGQPVVVENRPGQAAAVATELGARAAPDGHTLLMANIGTMALNPAIYPNYPVNPVRDFAPVSRLVTYSLVIFVPADAAPASLTELVAMARARPGQLNYGSAGNGGITHIAGELFKRAAGVDLVHVPYKRQRPRDDGPGSRAPADANRHPGGGNPVRRPREAAGLDRRPALGPGPAAADSAGIGDSVHAHRLAGDRRSSGHAAGHRRAPEP